MLSARGATDSNNDTMPALFPERERHLDKPTGLLSGGEQQMLGLAAVLSREPKLLLVAALSFGLAPAPSSGS
ncbi:hypothetical protein ACWD4G_30755 [Streptomyces sp. NPDC002643]